MTTTEIKQLSDQELATLNERFESASPQEIVRWARKIVIMVKGTKLKVQTAIQGEKLRVTGKKRDDLQQVIALLKDANLGIPLQHNNFRD